MSIRKNIRETLINQVTKILLHFSFQLTSGNFFKLASYSFKLVCEIIKEFIRPTCHILKPTLNFDEAKRSRVTPERTQGISKRSQLATRHREADRSDLCTFQKRIRWNVNTNCILKTRDYIFKTKGLFFESSIDWLYVRFTAMVIVFVDPSMAKVTCPWRPLSPPENFCRPDKILF